MGALHVLDGVGGGDGPTVVLLHGLGGRATHFRFVVRRMLPRVRRVVVPDLLAHGLSEVPAAFHGRHVMGTVAEALRQVLDEPFVLFGNSMGGKAAVQFASTAPEGLLGLVISAPAGAVVTKEELEIWLNRFNVNSHGDALTLVERAFARQLAWPVRQIVAWGARRQLNAPAVRHLLQEISVDDCLEPELVRGLALPMLLLWGTGDELMAPQHLQWWLDHLPEHARVERPDGYGHSPFVECPDVLADLILDHCERL
jgi:pimeloyl-ACP methyl ester carboxylesterase